MINKLNSHSLKVLSYRCSQLDKSEKIRCIRFSSRSSRISVFVRLRISMKLQSVSIVFIIVVTGFVGMVSSLCLVRNTSKPKVYWYQCLMSTDYLAEVNKAPVNIHRLTFTNSKTKVVRDGSFARLSQNLERLAFFYSHVEEIEDNAFQGLTKLDLLAFIGNKLRVIKSAWFVGLSNLKTVSFQSNEIKHVEDNFFSILPPLEVLDISINEISCLPTSSFGNFKADKFHFRHNPLTWMCQALLMNWLDAKNLRYDYRGLDNMDGAYDLTKMCIRKLPASQLDENSLNKCVEKVTREFLPAEGNYTVEEVCRFLKETPSPFLHCTK